jgi:hypothetical protein
MRLESDAPTPPAPKKLTETMAMQRGVNLSELEQTARGVGFDTKGSGFSKKDNKANKIVIIVCASLGALILLLLVYVFAIAGK